jgi:hypothetical protein
VMDISGCAPGNLRARQIHTNVMTNQPCCTNDANCLCIPFTNNQQEATFWCWAAVSANVFNAMFPKKPQMRQCDVVKTFNEPVLAGGDPCDKAHKNNYNEIEDIGDVLDALNISDGFQTGVRFDTLVTELGGGAGAAEPVAVQINFTGGAKHYIAICGVHKDAAQHICVADPRYGGDPVELAFNDLFNYGYQDDVPGPPGTGVAQNFQRVKRS